MEQLCRVCMDSSVTLVDIFAERQQPSNKEPSLADMLNEFCEVKPKDLLPQHICLSCVLAAQNAYRFKRTCEESNRQLLRLLATKEENDTKCAMTFVQAVYQKDVIPVNLTCVKTEPFESNEVIVQNVPPPRKIVKRQLNSIQKPSKINNLARRITENAEDKPHKCKFCEKGFNRVYLMRVHEKRHTGEKTFFCKFCGKGFLRGHDLKIHTRTHTGERPYKCTSCPLSFVQNHLLRTHIQRKHSKELKLQSQFRIPPLLLNGQPDNITRKSMSRAPLKKSPTIKASVTKEPKVVKHRKQNTIKIQSSNFSALDKITQEPLTILERERRDKLPPVAYEELDFDFELNDIDFNFDFNQNNDLVHSILDPIISDPKPQKIAKSCKISKEDCEKIHFCETCGKSFLRRYALTQHNRTHTGERPYKCNFCPLAFTQSQARKRHIRRIHLELRVGTKEIKKPPIKRLVVRVERLHLPQILSPKCID